MASISEKTAWAKQKQKNDSMFLQEQATSLSIQNSPLKLNRPIDSEERALAKFAKLVNVTGIPLSATDERGTATILSKHVVALNLYGLKLQCACDDLICSAKKFRKMRMLRMGTNEIYGEIPRAILSTDFKELRILRLDRNLLTGEVPPEIEHLINLEDLNLSRNLLTGELPHELGQLANLKTLILFGNKFILPNGITNKAEGHLHILSDATKVKFLMKKLFQASDKDSGSSAILAAARARRLAAEESDRRAVENARASRVIGYESGEIQKWFDSQLGIVPKPTTNGATNASVQYETAKAAIVTFDSARDDLDAPRTAAREENTESSTSDIHRSSEDGDAPVSFRKTQGRETIKTKENAGSRSSRSSRVHHQAAAYDDEAQACGGSLMHMIYSKKGTKNRKKRMPLATPRIFDDGYYDVIVPTRSQAADSQSVHNHSTLVNSNSQTEANFVFDGHI